MKVAFVSNYDPRDPSLWAGSTYHMAKALERQGIEIEYIGPLRQRFALPFKAITLFHRKVLGQAFERNREPLVLRGYARQIERRLREIQVEAVFTSGSFAIAQLDTHLPIVMWSDATYDRLITEYLWEPPPARRTRRLGRWMDAEAQKRCALLIYTSDWAARSAIEEYKTDPAKVRVVPYGANIDSSRDHAQIERAIEERRRDQCNLLFIGTGWERKGGDIAVEVARRLNQRGLKTELTILGSMPPLLSLPPYVKPLGFISKKTEACLRQFEELFCSSHFLLLPARAEAFGVVLCEACSFGVPCIASRVGGIPTIVRDGINGHLLGKDCGPDRYADLIIEVFDDPARYAELARSAFDEYERRLNWDTAANQVKGELRKILHH